MPYADPSLSYPVPYSPKWNIIDATKIKELERCPRKFFFSEVLGWKDERPSRHLVFGDAMHEAMEHLWEFGHKPSEVPAAMDKFLATYRKDFPSNQDEANAPKDPQTMREALHLYVLNHPEYNDYKLVYLEGRTNITAGIVGSVPVNETDVVHFKMDAIVEPPRPNEVIAFEHKSAYAGAFTGKNRGPWAGQWQTSMQVSVYSHALYCIFDAMIKKSLLINGIAPAKKGTEFMQVPVSKSYAMMNAWLYQVNYYLDSLKHSFNLLSEASPSDPAMSAFPMNDQACGDFGGCPFLAFCSAWHNPLQKCETPPIGYTIRHWDPTEKVKDAGDVLQLKMK